EEAGEFMKIYKRYAIDKNVSLKYSGPAGENGKLYDTNWGSLYVEQRGNEVAIIDEFTLEDEIGKRMDFILQEMNREVTTILSKTSGLDELGAGIGQAAIEIKVEIEKLREQVQNIE
ncbi:MAG: DUF1732 domain-containing protein, partial [Acidobacteria bacterium]|nr:DUF1732 domain-containing protein [Acidobacteriota bacterium]